MKMRCEMPLLPVQKLEQSFHVDIVERSGGNHQNNASMEGKVSFVIEAGQWPVMVSVLANDFTSTQTPHHARLT
jgi:hypothetical protein